MRPLVSPRSCVPIFFVRELYAGAGCCIRDAQDARDNPWIFRGRTEVTRKREGNGEVDEDVFKHFHMQGRNESFQLSCAPWKREKKKKVVRERK